MLFRSPAAQAVPGGLRPIRPLLLILAPALLLTSSTVLRAVAEPAPLPAAPVTASPAYAAPAAAAPVIAVPVAPDKAADDFNLGVGLYRDQRFELCAQTFRQFLEEFPEHPRANLARVYLGLSLSSLEQYREAREQFADNLQAEPEGANAADVRYRLGECSYYLEEYESAIAQLNEYLNRHPGHALNDWARLFLGDAHNELQQPEAAETVLRQLLDSSENPALLPDARFRLARALEQQDKTQEAFTLYRSVGSDAESEFAPRALARIGALYFGRQQFEDAANVYDEIVTRFPQSGAAASARLNSGLALYRKGDWEAALERLTGVPADSPLAAQAVVLRALSLKELGRHDDARTAFNEALAAAGNSPLAADIVFQLAQLERAAGRSADAASLFEDLADRWPQDTRVADSLFNAVELRIETGDTPRAARLWDRLAQESPDFAGQPRSLTLHGRLLLAQDQPAEAVTVLQRAAEAAADPASRDGAVARYYLVRAHQQAGQDDRALEVADSLAPHVDSEQLQGLTDVLLLAATAALNLERHSDARRYAEQFLEQPGTPTGRRQALAVRLLATTELSEDSAALADARQLVTEFPNQPATWDAVLTAAQNASSREQWSSAGRLYGLAAENRDNPAVRESGLAGVAWSHFRSGRFAEARSAFADVISEFPESADAPLLHYMQAVSAEEDQQTQAAADLYLELFDRVTGDMTTPVTGAIADRSPLQYAFDGGRQAARLLESLNEIDRADAVWERVAEQFAAADGADSVLDEWAHLNLKHNRFPRADQIHRRLIDRFPNSPHAPEARLSLAESQLADRSVDAAREQFRMILDDPASGDFVRSRALYHLVDIAIATGQWETARTRGEEFLSRFPANELVPQVRILLSDALLNTDAPAEAQSHLSELRDQVLAGNADPGPLTDRIWVLLTRAALDQKQYDRIDPLAKELLDRSPESRWAFQVRESQGRRWMRQAPPDFSKARDYFRQVVDDPIAKGSRTAANCQLLIADAHQRDNNLAEARREYFLLYYTTEGNDDLRAEALYRAAVCEMDLGETASAARSLRDLMEKFPDSPRSKDAAAALRTLSSEGNSNDTSTADNSAP